MHDPATMACQAIFRKTRRLENRAGRDSNRSTGFLVSIVHPADSCPQETHCR
jgi:hypothetical protein